MVIQLKSVVLSKVRGIGKDLPRIRKIAMRDVGEFWHRQILGRHFRPSARSEYNHAQRRQDWIEDKRKIGQGQGKSDDNVLFGRSRRFLSHAPRFTPTSRGVTVRMDAPAYFVRPKHKGGVHPDKPKEITTVSSRDRELIRRRMESKIGPLVQQALNNRALRKVFKR